MNISEMTPPRRTPVLANVTGQRGEHLLYLALTDFTVFPEPLFEPAFLGDKWPSIDFYVELRGLSGSTPYFLAQVKSTSEPLRRGARSIKISTSKDKCNRLFALPGPTYIFAVHEPSRRVFVRALFTRPSKGVYSVSIKNELTSANLQALHAEVRDFWSTHPHKPTRTNFK